MIKLKRSLLPKLEPNLTPLVDVIFLLLIFFILGSSLNKHNLLKINLPASHEQEKAVGDLTIISVDQEQNLYFNGKTINKESLIAALEKLNEKEKVILAADKSIPYQTIVEIMNLASRSGIRFLSLDTKE